MSQKYCRMSCKMSCDDRNKKLDDLKEPKTCRGKTRAGRSCKRKPSQYGEWCHIHRPANADVCYCSKKLAKIYRNNAHTSEYSLPFNECYSCSRSLAGGYLLAPCFHCVCVVCTTIYAKKGSRKCTCGVTIDVMIPFTK